MQLGLLADSRTRIVNMMAAPWGLFCCCKPKDRASSHQSSDGTPPGFQSIGQSNI